MENWQDKLDAVYFGNSVADYLWFLGALLIGFLLVKYLSHGFSNLIYKIIAEKAAGVSPDKLFRLIAKPLQWLIMLAIVYVATSHLEYPETWDLAPKEEYGLRMVVSRGFGLLVICIILWVFLKLVDFGGMVLTYKASLTESKTDDQIIPFVIDIAKIFIVTIAVFFVLGSIFKVDIGALVAGLGIGGLALALAAKESLENLLASFTIFFDKPFVVGDFVKVGDISGTVERIGFRSTRIRTLQKTLVSVPNRKMVQDVLDNWSLQTSRRVDFKIGLLYSTSRDQLQDIVLDIQKTIDEHPHTVQGGLVRLSEFGESSLDILIQFYIDIVDWGQFLQVKEEINYRIIEIVRNHNSDFAFPSQTVYTEKPLI